MWRVSLLLIASLSLVSSAFAQGELLDQGQSGFFTTGSTAFGENLYGGGVQLGYALKGKVDFAVGTVCTKRTITYRPFLYDNIEWTNPLAEEYTHKYTTWQTSVSAVEHVMRYRRPEQLQFVLSLYQAFNWVGEDFFPLSETPDLLSAGAALTLRRKPSPIRQLLLTAGYVRTFRDIDNSSGTFSVDGTIAFSSGQTWLSISPGVSFQSGLTTFGVTLGATFTNSRSSRYF